MEKRKIPLYASFNFREGIYTSWKTFCKQIPDKPLVVETSDEAYKVKTPDTDGKLQKVNPKDIYAIVYRGRPQISTIFGYYLLRKEENDFYFTGKIKVQGKKNLEFTYGLLFGLAGALVADESSSQQEMEIKLDHYNGTFIQVASKSLKQL